MSSLTDYYKWQMIVAIMKTMKSFPIAKKDSLFTKNKYIRASPISIFPEDSNIENPPI